MDKIGERIRKRREYLELSMKSLAENSGITPSMLSQIENGKASPSLHTIKHIADCLNTSVGALIGENESIAHNPVVTWKEKKLVKNNTNGATLFLLTQYSPIQSMEVYLVELEPGGHSGDLLDNRRYGQEFCFSLNGSLEVVLNEQTHALTENDSIYYYSHDLKMFRNPSASTVRILWIISPLIY